MTRFFWIRTGVTGQCIDDGLNAFGGEPVKHHVVPVALEQTSNLFIPVTIWQVASRIGKTRSVEPLAHRQRVNVLGALRHDGQLIWTTQQRPTTRNDIIALSDRIADQPHNVPRIVLLDNAGIYKGDVTDQHRRRWAVKGLCLYYLPPYSPELNRIEIL
jgi:hypothetical protein